MNPLTATTLAALVAIPSASSAGCIGPVIMGKCEGQEVPFSTHQNPGQDPGQAPPGFHWDHRQDQGAMMRGEVDPMTGRNPNDSQWFDQQQPGVRPWR